MFVFGTADDVFNMAVRIEENGKAFYTGAAQKAKDSRVKGLFEELAEMEDGHIKQFKDLRSRLVASIAHMVWDPEGLGAGYLNAAADSHVFTAEAATERLKGINTAEAAIEMALRFEKDSVAFFLGMKQMLPDAGGKDDIDSLIQSEMDHISMLSEVKNKLIETGTASIPT